MCDTQFTTTNLEFYLNELTKIYKKLYKGKAKAELVIVGGAAILLNFNFRNSTTDIDAMIIAQADLKTAINIVGDKYHLNNNWLNNDFRYTASYSTRLSQYAVYYKTFYGVLSVYTLKVEYLIAMKAVSARKYKKDLSDIVGIIKELRVNNRQINIEMIETALYNLYGTLDLVSSHTREFLQEILNRKDLELLFNETIKSEIDITSIVSDLGLEYFNKIDNDNINNVLNTLANKKKLTRKQTTPTTPQDNSTHFF